VACKSGAKNSLIVKGRFSLDTNILVYAIDRDAGVRHGLSWALVGRAARSDCVLAAQALARFFHATTRMGLLAHAAASALARDWLDVFHVNSVNTAALVDAMDAVGEHGLSFWDAMFRATARQSGCWEILSEDMQDGRRLGGVEFVNPFTEDASTRLEPLLAP